MMEIFEALASSANFDELLTTILKICLRELRAEQGSVLLLQTSDPSSLKMLATVGMPQTIVDRGYVPRRGSISEYVLIEKRPVIINDVPRTDHFETMAADTSTPRSIFSAICVPLLTRGRILGTMNINRTRTNDRFGPSDLEAAALVGGQAAIVIENSLLREELVRKERLAAVGETVAGISHCIKNILTGIRGGVGLTEMGLEQDNQNIVRDGFDIFRRSSETLSNLVLDLLDYSKDRKPARAHFAISEAVQPAIEAAAFKGRPDKVSVTCTDYQPVEFYGDRDQIYRALLNLTLNAVDAFTEGTSGGGTPAVRLAVNVVPAQHLPPDSQPKRLTPQWLKIDVEDNGPGIAPEQQERIWELFFSTKGSRGTGLGLAATRKMIEEHGGFIYLDSEVGRGTTFSVYLPMLSPADADASLTG